MKPRSAIKSDLFAAESRGPKIDSLGERLSASSPNVSKGVITESPRCGLGSSMYLRRSLRWVENRFVRSGRREPTLG